MPNSSAAKRDRRQRLRIFVSGDVQSGSPSEDRMGEIQSDGGSRPPGDPAALALDTRGLKTLPPSSALARQSSSEIIKVMAVRIVRLGTARHSNEGLRIGTVRRPPRGIRKADYARRNFYDAWLPELSPSAPLVSWLLSEPITAKRWTLFERRYRKEMAQPAAQRLIALLAALSSQTNFSVGCYCEDESHCHRSLLKKLLIEQGSDVA